MNRALLTAILALVACTPRAIRREPPPLLHEGELLVFVQPFGDDARRLAFTVGGVAAVGPGGPAPLEVDVPAVSSETVRHQRLLAHGRLAPGQYSALEVRVAQASIAGEDGPSALLVDAEPYRVPVSFTIARRGGTVLWLSVRRPDPAQTFSFDAPMLAAQAAHPTVPALVGYCTSRGANLATVFDRRARLVTGALPTGREPSGVVLEPGGVRAYVALRQEDAIEVVDVASGTTLQRIPLRGGDRPRELALASDGRTLLVLNELSSTLAFVDTVTFAEVARVPVGEEPWSMVLEPGRRRAFVLARRAGSISVVDLATRSVLRALATDPGPLRAAVDRRGIRLYVVFEGTPYLSVYALPSLALEQRVNVGLGARFVMVDPRSDLLYVAREGEARVSVLDPMSLVPLDAFDVPGPVSYMAIDDTENALFALVPSRRSIAVVDLTSRRTLAILDAGPDPFAFALTGERH